VINYAHAGDELARAEGERRVIGAPMDEIRDRFGATYTVTRVVQVFKGCISDALVYKDSNRR